MTDAADPLFTGRLRAMQFASYVSILFACSVFALLVGKHWAWGPFILTAGLIAAGAVANDLIARQALSWFHPTDEQLRRAALKRRQRNVVLIPGHATFAVGFGLIAGSIPSYWVAFACGVVLLVVTVLVPLAMLPSLKRRMEAQNVAPPNTQ